MKSNNRLIHFLTVALGLSLLLMTGCSSISVNYDYDTSVDFGQYSTYAWAPDQVKTTPPLDAAKANQHSGLLSNRIRSSVDKQMAAKGFNFNESDPELLAIFHIGVKDKIQVTDWGYRYSNYYWGGYSGRQIDVYQYQEGQMIIDLIDAQSHNLVWRGSGTGVVDQSQKSPEEMQARIDKAVATILANFPPPGK